MKPCPYRKVHEYDGEGLCLHCFAKAPPPPPAPPVLEGLDSAFAISPSTQSNYVYGVNPFWTGHYGQTLSAQDMQKILDDAIKKLGQP